MPSTAPKVKKDAVAEYGGKIIECLPTLSSREAAAEKVGRETGATFIHPSNDENVIVGQGTAGMELLEVQSDLDFIIVPVGGGDLSQVQAWRSIILETGAKSLALSPLKSTMPFVPLKVVKSNPMHPQTLSQMD